MENKIPLSITVPEIYTVISNSIEIGMKLAFISVYLWTVNQFKTNSRVIGVHPMGLLLIPACFVALYVAVPLVFITFMFYWRE